MLGISFKEGFAWVFFGGNLLALRAGAGLVLGISFREGFAWFFLAVIRWFFDRLRV